MWETPCYFSPRKNPQIWFWYFDGGLLMWLICCLKNLFVETLTSSRFKNPRVFIRSDRITNVSSWIPVIPPRMVFSDFHQALPHSKRCWKVPEKNLIGRKGSSSLNPELLNFGGVEQIHECPWRKLEPWLIRFALLSPNPSTVGSKLLFSPNLPVGFYM